VTIGESPQRVQAAPGFLLVAKGVTPIDRGAGLARLAVDADFQPGCVGERAERHLDALLEQIEFPGHRPAGGHGPQQPGNSGAQMP
jgi:hypothetical protein